MTSEHWDKDILDLVKHNAEIKKLEKYLWETKHSCLFTFSLRKCVI